MPPDAPEGAPNILYVVIDDIGFGWIEPFGGLIRTPAIERLANNGLRYTNFTTTALCSPTRSCLITGRNHHSVGMANIPELASGFPGYNARQPQNKAGVAAMLHEHGYTSFCLGKWHNTPSEETGISGPYDRWPVGPVFGFDRFYGFLGGDSDQWYPKLFMDREAIDQPRLPEDGYHLSEDLADKTISWIAQHKSIAPEQAMADLPRLRGDACAASCLAGVGRPLQGPVRYGVGRLPGADPGPAEGAGHRARVGGAVADARGCAGLGRPVGGREEAVRSDGRGLRRLHGAHRRPDRSDHRLPPGDRPTRQHALVRVRRRQRLLWRGHPQRPLQRAERHDLHRRAARDRPAEPRAHRSARPAGVLQPLSGRVGLCRQHTVQAVQAVRALGGVHNPLVVHWPDGIKAKGELRHQYHHVTDIVPTILDAIGIEAPRFVNTVQQEPIEGESMRYTFASPDAATTHPTQYFEMLGNRGLIHDGWRVVTYHGRKPWENTAAWTFEEDHWELYDLANDPAEAHDLMEGRDTSNLDDPMVKKCLELVTMWWAQAGQYQVLPLDDRFRARALDREVLYAGNPRTTWYEGAVRIQPFEAPLTLNRSWSMVVTIEVLDGGATGPIAAMGGDCAGWSLYLNDGVPTYCYNFPGPEYTYLRGTEALAPGRHEIGYTFEKTGSEPLGAGGTGRLTVDGAQVAEDEIPRTCTVGYSIDETFDIGWDKGSPVSEDYGPVARFTGRIIKVDFDAQPDLHPDHDDHHAEAKLTHAMIRQ